MLFKEGNKKVAKLHGDFSISAKPVKRTSEKKRALVTDSMASLLGRFPARARMLFQIRFGEESENIVRTDI